MESGIMLLESRLTSCIKRCKNGPTTWTHHSTSGIVSFKKGGGFLFCSFQLAIHSTSGTAFLKKKIGILILFLSVNHRKVVGSQGLGTEPLQPQGFALLHVPPMPSTPPTPHLQVLPLGVASVFSSLDSTGQYVPLSPALWPGEAHLHSTPSSGMSSLPLPKMPRTAPTTGASLHPSYKGLKLGQLDRIRGDNLGISYSHHK